jgi:hypothetical protein
MLKKAACPKERSPVYPKRRLKLMAKRIMMSISVRKTMRKLDRNSGAKINKMIRAMSHKYL